MSGAWSPPRAARSEIGLSLERFILSLVHEFPPPGKIAADKVSAAIFAPPGSQFHEIEVKMILVKRIGAGSEHRIEMLARPSPGPLHEVAPAAQA